MKRQFLIAIKIFLLMTFLTGIVYTAMITAFASVVFPGKAAGSLVVREGKIKGSELMGQQTSDLRYFWPRPSVSNYDPMLSSGSNLGSSSKKLKEQVAERKSRFIMLNQLPDSISIPVEMLTASASGLDPHISPRAALLQTERIAKARKLNSSEKERLIRLIEQTTEKPQFNLLGEERVNVLKLNLKIDSLFSN